MKTSIKTNLLVVLSLAIRIPLSGVLVDVIVEQVVLVEVFEPDVEVVVTDDDVEPVEDSHPMQ